MPAASSNSGSESGGNAPVHAIRKHSLKASIWRNDTRNGAMYNVTLLRTYRDGEEFKDTPSLGFDDLTNAAKVLTDAETWIGEQMLRDRSEAQEHSAPPPARQREGRKA
jgi:hypothetical protein